jgi:hypothetical protein
VRAAINPASCSAASLIRTTNRPPWEAIGLAMVSTMNRNRFGRAELRRAGSASDFIALSTL